MEEGSFHVYMTCKTSVSKVFNGPSDTYGSFLRRRSKLTDETRSVKRLTTPLLSLTSLGFQGQKIPECKIPLFVLSFPLLTTKTLSRPCLYTMSNLIPPTFTEVTLIRTTRFYTYSTLSLGTSKDLLLGKQVLLYSSYFWDFTLTQTEQTCCRF